MAFVRQEAAEGKGPYEPPTEAERYTIQMAKIALLWSEIDGASFRIHDFSFTPENWHPPKRPLERSEATKMTGECLVGVEHLINCVNHIGQAAVKPFDHRKVLEGLCLQKEGLETSLRILRGDAEDEYVELGRPDVFDTQEKENRFGQQINVLQEGRTRLCYAFERIVGPLWGMADSNDCAPKPFGATLHLADHSLEAERYHINQMAPVFKRHPGKRVVILKLPVGNWQRTVVFEEGLVSGSDAMRREMERLIDSCGWNPESEAA
jgi:hypothetical protein